MPTKLSSVGLDFRESGILMSACTLKFHLFLVSMKSLYDSWEEGRKTQSAEHNKVWNILTSVKLRTAGAAVQISVTFSSPLLLA